MTETERDDLAERRATKADLRRLRKDARAQDEPNAEEQAFQEGWDAAYSSIDESRRASRCRAAPRPPEMPPRPARRRKWSETVRLAYVLAGYPPPRKRKGPA